MKHEMHRREFITGASLAVLGAMTAPAWAVGTEQRSRLRVAQIGTAHSHAPGKWEALQRRRDLFDLVGVWEPDAALQAHRQKEATYRGARWLSEAELFDTKLDAVLIETELPDLLSMAHRALEADWHVHIDKPPGADMNAFTALQTLAERRRRVLQMGYMWRYHPAFQYCFDLLRQGTLGNVFAIHGDLGKYMPADRRAWIGEVYSGSMMSLGSHVLDIAVAILGKPEHVTAVRRRTYPKRDRFFDNELAVLEYPDAVATIRSMLTEVAGEERRQFAVFGDKGSFEILPIEPARARLALLHPPAGTKSGYHQVDLPPVAHRYDGMLEDFVGMVHGEPTRVPQYTPAHDRTVQEIALKFHTV